MNNDAYEQDREDNAVGESFAAECEAKYRMHHSYFYEDCDEAQNEMEDPQEPDVKLELMVQSWEHRLLRAARETTQGSFLMSALRRNGVL